MSNREMVSKKIAVFKVNLKSAIKQFLYITKPMHKLTSQEINVLTLILFSYYREQVNFKRDDDVWKFVFDYDNKMNIKKELQMGNAVFQNTLTALRKKNVLKDNKVVPVFRPNIKQGDKVFELTFRFELNGQ
jgi:hypothetical protein